MKPRAVLLDFDGVVVDSLPTHLAAWVAATETVFKRPLTDADSLRGRGTSAIAGIIAKRLGDPSLASSLTSVKQAWLAQNIASVPLLPGAAPLVAELARLAIPHGIASNSPGAFVRGVLAANGLRIADVIAGDEVARGKPHPAIFWQLANRLGLRPEERCQALVFEDSEHGVRAAKKAGMIPIGVLSSISRERLTAAGAAAVCENLGEALARGWLVSFSAPV